MEKVRGTESKEKSFLKGVVGKRLEELAASQSRVDPLELLGLSSPPASSVSSERTLPEPSSIPPFSQVTTVPLSIPSAPQRTSTTGETKKDTRSSQSLRKSDGEGGTLTEYSDSATPLTDRIPIHPVDSESGTVRASVSGTHSSLSSHAIHQLHTTPEMPPLHTPPPPDVPISLLKPPSHWVRFAWALHSCRDHSIPNQTRPVSYAEIGALVDRTEDAVRRSLLQLMSAGLIVRKALLQYAHGGSIYLFGTAFPALLAPLPTAKKKGPKPRHLTHGHSPSDSQNFSQNAPSSSSYSSLPRPELLQEWGVQNLILSEWFTGLEPRSVEPFLRVMPSVEYAQDFFDKVAGVIEQKKTTSKPIADALAFLFACLKKMEVNPPPGWRSRRVRLVEDEARRLEDEAAALKGARARLEAQRAEVYFLGLSEEAQTQLRRTADEAAAETELAIVRDAKRERRLQELIRDHMRQDQRIKSI